MARSATALALAGDAFGMCDGGRPDMTAGTIWFSIVASAFGLAYMTYGKRQARMVPLVAGLGLCVYTYFVQGWLWLIVIGVALLALPFVVDA